MSSHLLPQSQLWLQNIEYCEINDPVTENYSGGSYKWWIYSRRYGIILLWSYDISAIKKLVIRRAHKVTQVNSHMYIVDLQWKYCGHFQERNLPFRYTFSFILVLEEPSKAYLPITFEIATWKATYEQNIPPVTLDYIRIFEHKNPYLVRQADHTPTKL